MTSSCECVLIPGIESSPIIMVVWQWSLSYDASWWRHQMEAFSASLVLCVGNSPVTVNSPYKGQWRGALVFSLICTWISGRVNNREAGDLRRRRAHYDVIVMLYAICRASCGNLSNTTITQRAHICTHYSSLAVRRTIGSVPSNFHALDCDKKHFSIFYDCSTMGRQR